MPCERKEERHLVVAQRPRHAQVGEHEGVLIGAAVNSMPARSRTKLCMPSAPTTYRARTMTGPAIVDDDIDRHAIRVLLHVGDRVRAMHDSLPNSRRAATRWLRSRLRDHQA